MSLGQVLAVTAAVLVDDRRVGSAVLVNHQYLLTAAHVLPKNKDGRKIEVIFPGSHAFRTVVTVTPLPSEAEKVDVAALSLSAELGNQIPKVLKMWAGQRLPHEVKVFGYPKAEKSIQGVWRKFTVSGPTSSGAIQLDWEHAGTFVGQSGGAVVDADKNSLVGIVTHGSSEGRFDRFVPLTLIETFLKGLHRPWLYAGEDARNHFNRRAFSRRNTAEEVDLFRGRSTALHAVSEWATQQRSSGHPMVITGQPGAGKSALLARCALTLEETGDIPGIVFHARGATELELLDAVSAAVGLEVVTSVDDLVRHSEEFPSAKAPLIVLVDALDEAAAGQATQLASALAELARFPWFRVVVATRPLTSGERYLPGSLLAQLRIQGPTSHGLVDLDVEPYRDYEALVEYTEAVLAQEGHKYTATADAAWRTYRKDRYLRARLARAIADRAQYNFLVAAITAITIAEKGDIVDPKAPGFNVASLPASVGEALEKCLSAMTLAEQDKARGLLIALAYARGSGISHRMWLVFAQALGYQNDRSNIDSLFAGRATDYLVQSINSAGDTTLRLFHQALNDQLLKDRPQEDEYAITSALVKMVKDAGGWTRANYYATHYAAEHAAAAGCLQSLLSDPIFIIYADPSRLAAVISQVPPKARTPIERMILKEMARVLTLQPGQRAEIYALVAARQGLSYFMTAFNEYSTGSLHPYWAHFQGTFAQTIPNHSGLYGSLAVGRLGNRDVIIAAGHSGVRVWDEHGQFIEIPLPRGKSVSAVAVGQLGTRHVVLASTGDGVLMWDEHGQALEHPNEKARVKTLDVGQFGTRDVIVTASEYGVLLWNEHGQRVGHPANRQKDVLAVAVGKFGARDVIVTATKVGVLLWDEHGQWLEHPLNHIEGVADVAMGSINGVDVIVTTSYQSTQVWDEHGQSVHHPLNQQMHHGAVGVAAGRLGTRDVIVVATINGVVRVWDEHEYLTNDSLNSQFRTVYRVITGRFLGKDVIVSIEAGSARVWDEHGQLVDHPLNQADDVECVAAGKLDGQNVIVGAVFRGIQIWDENGNSVKHPLVYKVKRPSIASNPNQPFLATEACNPFTDLPLGHSDVVMEMAVGQMNGQGIIVTTGDEVMRIWNREGKVSVHSLRRKKFVSDVFVVRLGDKDAIITVGRDEIRMCDELGRPLAHSLNYERNAVSAAAGRLGDRNVFVISGRQFFRIWGEHHRPTVGRLRHEDVISKIAVGQLDGKDVIALADMESNLYLWDWDTQIIKGRFSLLEQADSLAIHPNGIIVVTDGTMMMLKYSTNNFE